MSLIRRADGSFYLTAEQLDIMNIDTWPGVTDKGFSPVVKEPEPVPTTIEQFRTILKEGVDMEEQRHPQFQNKEWLTRAKEALNNSRI